MQKENDLTVTDFYTKFKGIYDDLNELQLLQECSCGASKELMEKKEYQNGASHHMTALYPSSN